MNGGRNSRYTVHIVVCPVNVHTEHFALNTLFYNTPDQSQRKLYSNSQNDVQRVDLILDPWSTTGGRGTRTAEYVMCIGQRELTPSSIIKISSLPCPIHNQYLITPINAFLAHCKYVVQQLISYILCELFLNM